MSYSLKQSNKLDLKKIGLGTLDMDSKCFMQGNLLMVDIY